MTIPQEKLNPLHWGTLILILIVIAAAIYAMTTWNDSKTSPQTTKFPGRSSQLLDQNHAVKLQADPASGNINGGSSGLQSAGSTDSSSGDVNSPKYSAPPTSGVCGPPRDGKLSEAMCPL